MKTIVLGLGKQGQIANVVVGLVSVDVVDNFTKPERSAQVFLHAVSVLGNQPCPDFLPEIPVDQFRLADIQIIIYGNCALLSIDEAPGVYPNRQSNCYCLIGKYLVLFLSNWD